MENFLWGMYELYKELERDEKMKKEFEENKKTNKE